MRPISRKGHMNYYAIDLGASSGRLIKGCFENGRLRLEELYRFANGPLELEGTLRWDVDFLEEQIGLALQKADPDGEATLGIDTWGVDYVLLDSEGNRLDLPYHYRDGRTAGTVPEVNRKVEGGLYPLTGIQQLEINTVNQLSVDTRLKRAGRLLFIPDYLTYRLTGRQQTEYTIASTSGLLDPERRVFSDRILDAFSLSDKLFAPMVAPGTPVGPLLEEWRAKFGVPRMQVVAVGSHDTASAVLAAPLEEDDLYISSGTWSLMGTELTRPVVNEMTQAYNYTNEGGVENTIRFLKNIMGLWILQESRRQWGKEGKHYSFSELSDLAREAQPYRSLINPDAPEFTPPGDMPARIRAYCRKTGQPVPESVGEMVRCIKDSLAMKYRQVALELETVTGRGAKRICIVGGGSQDEQLCQACADSTGKKVLAGPVEATAIGNILMQMKAQGTMTTLNRMRQCVQSSFGVTAYAPDPSMEPVCARAFDRFMLLQS